MKNLSIFQFIISQNISKAAKRKARPSKYATARYNTAYHRRTNTHLLAYDVINTMFTRYNCRHNRSRLYSCIVNIHWNCYWKIGLSAYIFDTPSWILQVA